jgi:magnesium chelatase family protein
MLARLHSVTLEGIEGTVCEVEVDVSRSGFDKPMVVGLPDAAVKESIERVRSAIVNSGFKFPDTQSLVNLAPADIKKVGPAFDLPIALGMLAASGSLHSDSLKRFMVVGELALDGRVRPVSGVLSMAMAAEANGFSSIIVPLDNAREAAVVQNIDVYGVASLAQAIGVLTDELPMETTSVDIDEIFAVASAYDIDFSDVKGQEMAKRAITIAAAGGHNIMMIGPPGSGKTLLSKRIATIMPPLTLEESLETTRIYSSVGMLDKHTALIATRPVRAPHHTASGPALVGGGTTPRPGELSLAHHGILFLDEFAEFPRHVLEMIRQPLEAGTVTISRAKGTMTFPAKFIFVAAMNPCPCGHSYNSNQLCKCTPNQIDRYMGRISGPLIDRIDIHVDVNPVPFDTLSSKKDGQSSADMLEHVYRARERQAQRFGNDRIMTNAHMNTRQMREHCPLDEQCQMLLKQAYNELGLSARAHDKVVKMSRTIADIENCDEIQTHHLAEAIQYRKLDRKL